MRFLLNIIVHYRLGSKFCVNETSQSWERYSAQMQAAIRGEKILEELSRTRFFTGFEFPALFFGAP